MPGTLRARSSGRDLLAEAAAAHEHEPLGHLRELVGELHGDAAAEAVADDGGALVAEHAEQVADARRVGAEAVVAAGLGALAVAEQVGGDHGVALGEQRHHRHPGAGAAGDPVDHHEQRALAGLPVGDVVAVDLGPPGGGGLPGELAVGRTEAGQRDDLRLRARVGGVTRATGGHEGPEARSAPERPS